MKNHLKEKLGDEIFDRAYKKLQDAVTPLYPFIHISIELELWTGGTGVNLWWREQNQRAISFCKAWYNYKIPTTTFLTYSNGKSVIKKMTVNLINIYLIYCVNVILLENLYLILSIFL